MCVKPNPYKQTALKQGMDGELHPANENLFGVIRTIHTIHISRNVTFAWTANLMSSISFSSYFGSS